MKITQISEHIWSLRTWIVIPITVWMVVEEDRVALVDELPYLIGECSYREGRKPVITLMHGEVQSLAEDNVCFRRNNGTSVR